MWFGAVCPWHKFLDNDVIPLYRLVPLGILVLLFRRLPWVFAIHKKIPQIEQIRQAIFVGFFGPVGVSAIFYLYITNEFLATLKGDDGKQRSDVVKLPDTVLIVVWFLCICSVVSPTNPPLIIRLSLSLSTSHLTITHQVVHGLSIPLGKLGYYLPRTLSRGITEENSGNHTPFHISGRVSMNGLRLPTFSISRRNSLEEEQNRVQNNTGAAAAGPESPGGPKANTARPVWRIGGTLIRDERGKQEQEQQQQQQPPPPKVIGSSLYGSMADEGTTGGGNVSPPPGSFDPTNRTIRFPDEAHEGGKGGRAVCG